MVADFTDPKVNLKKSNCQPFQLPWEQLAGQQITFCFCRPHTNYCHLCIFWYIGMS